MSAEDFSKAERAGIAPIQYQTDPPYRILVVDDDFYIRYFNTEVLMGIGYKVDAAEDGDAAWQALNTDHNIPNVSGIELLKKLHAARMSIPVVLVSGVMPTEELNRHPWLQIEAKLLKPYTAVELLGTVAAVMRAPDDLHPRSEPPAQV